MEEISALRVLQKGLGETDTHGVEIYVTAMTLDQIMKYAKVDEWTTTNSDGYQRPRVQGRLRDLAKYILEDQGVLPTSVVVGTRPCDEPRIEPEDFAQDGSAVSAGKLLFPDGATLWVIDGQHRIYGVHHAYERGADQLKEYPFPVCIMRDVDRYTEMLHFNIVNTRQRKMSTDIVDRHLVQMKQAKGIQMVAAGSRGEKDYIRALATQVVDSLDETEGVWQHQIAIPGVAGRDKGLVRQHAMVVSIEPFLKDSWVRGISDDDKVKVLVNFWDAAKGAWPEAFASPKDYRLQATVGIYSLNMLLPVIVQRCLEDRDLSKEKMQALLEGMDLAQDFWHKEDGDPLTLGTGMASIRALTHTLMERLPQPQHAVVKM